MQPNLEKYTLMKKILSILSLCLLSMSMFAVIASPEPIEVTQPDGSTLTVKLVGDEFHSYYTTLDGTPLRRTASGKFVKDASVAEMPAQARKARQVVQKVNFNQNFPLSGSPKSIVILVNFTDVKFTYKVEDFQDMLNTSGYKKNDGIGSARDYFIACSDSIFSPIFDCYGPVTLSRDQAYYGKNVGGNNSANADQMVTEACQLVEEMGIDLAQYDTNNDGRLDNVFIYYAGHNEAEHGGDNTIWPHRHVVNSPIKVSGKTIYDYACTSELRGSTGTSMCGIGTFCHEFGHVLGLPDYYDTDDKDGSQYTIGDWDIMCSGSYNGNGKTPPTYTAGERFQLGWLVPTQLKKPGQYLLNPLSTSNEAFLIASGEHSLTWNNNQGEYWLLENRQNVGWDAALSSLPATGMLIWHIDYDASAWATNTPNNKQPLRYDIEEAGGNKGYSAASDPYPGSNNITFFTPTMHSGELLNQPIFNIKEVEELISFTYISDGSTTLRLDKEMIELTTTVNDAKKIESWDPQSFNLLGNGLDPEKQLTLTTGTNLFRLYAGEKAPARNSSSWQRSISIEILNDSSINQRVWVSFVPSKQDCEASKSNISIKSESVTTSLPLIGYAPRPTYVVTPTIVATTDITPYSFKTKWLNQEDAEQFYLTLYQIEEGKTDFKQGFENFDSAKEIQNEGWESNTTLTTTSDKADGSRALYFKKNGDEVKSETYPAAITELSFWYNAFASTKDTVGVIKLEAYNEKEWTVEDNIIVVKRSKKVTARYTFEPEKNYRIFRLVWMDKGERGVAIDAFTATASQKISYLYKEKDITLEAFTFGDTASYTFDGLTPNSTYYYQIQTTDLDKGCEEHLTSLSPAETATTIAGKPKDGEQLTIAYDSINYNPAQHAIYLTNPGNNDCLYFYTTDGRLIYSINVKKDVCIYPLNLNLFTRGEIYIVQHAIGSKLGRKNKWAKFVF